MEETLKRIMLSKEVKSVLIIDKEGFVIKSTMSTEETTMASKKYAQLIDTIHKELAQCDFRVIVSINNRKKPNI